VIAPPEWAWAGFPLDSDATETLDVAEFTAIALVRIKGSVRDQDEAPIGPVMHWAHILKTEQGQDGAWPAAVNARTGEPTGTARTLAPAKLMARLDALLDSSEYAACIALAANAKTEGEPDGTRGENHHSQ